MTPLEPRLSVDDRRDDLPTDTRACPNHNGSTATGCDECVDRGERAATERIVSAIRATAHAFDDVGMGSAAAILWQEANALEDGTHPHIELQGELPHEGGDDA